MLTNVGTPAALSKMGMRTVDVGCGTLSMHSIRETAGTQDVQNYIDLFDSFFEGFAKLDATVNFEWLLVNKLIDEHEMQIHCRL